MRELPALPTKADLQFSLLPRNRLFVNFLRVLHQRWRFLRDLSRRYDELQTEGRSAALLEVVCRTHILAENVLVAYEIAAGRMAIEVPGLRKDVYSRAGSRLPRRKFLSAAWQYNSIRQTLEHLIEANPDGAFTPDELSVLDKAINESCAFLDQQYKMIAQYRARYDPLAKSFRHGRRIFGVKLSGEADPDGSANFSMETAKDSYVVFRRTSGGKAKAVEYIFDEETCVDVRRVLAIAESQLPAMSELYSTIGQMLEGLLGSYDSGGTKAEFPLAPLKLISPNPSHELQSLVGKVETARVSAALSPST